ncbi:hypothetical protein K438DRAFT_1880804 [Mycena galopus ATCC 62051]|nr:hypothetical protein K438DRAFT_1880804 [Mycena galopus ATCC 62051]
MSTARQNLRGGDKALPKSAVGTTTPKGFQHGVPGPGGRAGADSVHRMDKEMAKISNRQDPFEEVSRCTAGVKRGHKESDEEEDPKPPAKKARLQRSSSYDSDKENLPDMNHSQESMRERDASVEIVILKEMGKGKERADIVTIDDSPEKAPAKPSKKGSGHATTQPKPNKDPSAKPQKSTKGKANEKSKESTASTSASANKTNTHTVEHTATEDNGKASPPTPAVNKPKCTKKDTVQTLDPAIGNPEYFPTLRTAMKMQGELLAGNLPHTQVYLDGYGKYLDAQHLLHEERLLAHNIDVHTSEERHCDTGLQMRAQELALREREIVLKEEELKLKVRDLTLREREFALRELVAGDGPQ